VRRTYNFNLGDEALIEDAINDRVNDVVDKERPYEHIIKTIFDGSKLMYKI